MLRNSLCGHRANVAGGLKAKIPSVQGLEFGVYVASEDALVTEFLKSEMKSAQPSEEIDEFESFHTSSQRAPGHRREGRGYHSPRYPILERAF